MADKKLSKSACAKYLMCAAGYDYHYNKGYRPIKTGSALVNGNGIDHGLNMILLGKGDPLLEFMKEFNKYEFGSIVPLVNDYDGELISDSDKKSLLADIKEYGYSGDDIDGLAATLLDRIKAQEVLSDNQYKVIDILCRASLARKAVLMFEAYRRVVMPNITKVYNVQKASGPGFLDATVEWLNVGKAVLDNKTSSKAYAKDSVDFSLELTLYAAEEKVNNGIYIVMNKQMKKNRIKICSDCGFKGMGTHTTCNNEVNKKRCGGQWDITIHPEAEIQIIHGQITPRAIEVATEVQEQIRHAVNEQIFFCNFAQCNSQFGKQCEYKNLHWKNDPTGFEIKPKVKK